MDEDVRQIDDILPIVSEGGNFYYSYDDFAFFDMREEHVKLIRRNSLRKSHCQNQLYFYQKYIYKAKSDCDRTGGYRSLVGRADIGNRENSHISFNEKDA
jgi:hypothetical protein